MVEFIEWLTGTHTCVCGAKYNVTVTKPLPGADDALCEKCGSLMDSRRNNSFLVYDRVPGDE
jgi:hypothetical protein